MFTKYGDGQIISVFDADEFLKKGVKKQKEKVKKNIDFNDDDLSELLIPEDEDNQGEDE